MTISKWKIAVALIGVLMAGFFGQRYYYEQVEKKNVERFLQERYGQEFVAQSCEYFQSEGMVGRKGIRTFVFSKEQPPIKVAVARFLDKSRDDLQSYFELNASKDGENYGFYFNQVWSREVDAKLQGVTESVFQRTIFFVSGINAPYPLLSQLQGQTPTYFGTLKNRTEVFSDTNFNFSQSFWLLSFYDLNEGNKPMEAERIFQFMSELRKLNINKYMLYIHYYTPTYMTDAKVSIKQVGGLYSFIEADSASVVPYGFFGSGKNWKYIMNLSRRDIDKIKSPSDIIPFFKPKIR